MFCRAVVCAQFSVGHRPAGSGMELFWQAAADALRMASCQDKYANNRALHEQILPVQRK